MSTPTMFSSVIPQSFTEALRVRCLTEPRITMFSNGVDNDRLFVDGGKEHAYFTYAGYTQVTNRPHEEWPAFVSLIYATDTNGYYHIMSLNNLPHYPMEDLADMVFATLEEHITSGFVEPTK